MQTSSIAVLLTCFNRRQKTLACLNALYNTQLPSGVVLHVFLVDDGCTDGTATVVRLAHPRVNIIQGSGNLYWNRGMHLAWTTAAAQQDFDFYLWLNDDTVLERSAIVELLKCSADENHQSIICGSTCAEDDPDEITYGGWRPKDALLTPCGTPQECDNINGNILLVPRAVYQRIGTNDPVFQHAMGDNDYGLRARAAGIRLIVAPHVLGVCNEHDRPDAWCDPSVPLFQRFRRLYSPLGNPPAQFFIYEKRHYGRKTAIYHFITTHLRTLLPAVFPVRR